MKYFISKLRERKERDKKGEIREFFTIFICHMESLVNEPHCHVVMKQNCSSIILYGGTLDLVINLHTGGAYEYNLNNFKWFI